MTSRLRQLLSANRWPFFLGGLLGMSVLAHGILVFVATRPDTPPPLPDYYRKSLQWDADAAVIEQSRRLGWTVQVEIPGGEPYAASARRPVDVTVQDAAGEPIRGLQGQLVALRPADGRLNGESPLVELPHAPGHYRTLAQLPARGVWDLVVDARLGSMRFVHQARVTVDEQPARASAATGREPAR